MADTVPTSQGRAIVAGATSQIGEFLIPLLLRDGHEVVALGRGVRPTHLPPEAEWTRLNIGRPDALQSFREPTAAPATAWFHLAPLPLLPPLIESIAALGVRRIVAFGSTSLFTKASSPDREEQRIAGELAAAEAELAAASARQAIAWTVLRPTLIYGGRAENALHFIARHGRRLGFFPLAGPAEGKRQPVHAEDLARACVAVWPCEAAHDRAYELGGAEVLTYRAMVERVLAVESGGARAVTLPPAMYRLALRVVRWLPRYATLSPGMVERMARDQVFDWSDAARDFSFAPRAFQPGQ